MSRIAVYQIVIVAVTSVKEWKWLSNRAEKEASLLTLAGRKEQP